MSANLDEMLKSIQPFLHKGDESNALRARLRQLNDVVNRLLDENAALRRQIRVEQEAIVWGSVKPWFDPARQAIRLVPVFQRISVSKDDYYPPDELPRAQSLK